MFCIIAGFVEKSCPIVLMLLRLRDGLLENGFVETLKTTLFLFNSSEIPQLINEPAKTNNLYILYLLIKSNLVWQTF